MDEAEPLCFVANEAVLSVANEAVLAELWYPFVVIGDRVDSVKPGGSNIKIHI